MRPHYCVLITDPSRAVNVCHQLNRFTFYSCYWQHLKTSKKICRGRTKAKLAHSFKKHYWTKIRLFGSCNDQITITCHCELCTWLSNITLLLNFDLIARSKMSSFKAKINKTHCNYLPPPLTVSQNVQNIPSRHVSWRHQDHWCNFSCCRFVLHRVMVR